MLFQSLQWVNLIVFFFLFIAVENGSFSPSQEVFFSPFLLKQLKLEESVNEEKEIEAKKSKKFEGD